MAGASAEVVARVTKAVLSSRKYASTAPATVDLLVALEAPNHKSAKALEKAVRKHLHNIMAPYLGDPDYAQAGLDLTAAFEKGQDAANTLLLEYLSTHESTKERIAIMEQFYQDIFAITGVPNIVLDLACALNPLAFPWMGLGPDTTFYSYDIHTERIDFLNTYFALQGIPQAAKLQDLALEIPTEHGDMALLLKELPRFERNYNKKGWQLLDALDVDWLVISFPTISLHGGRSLVTHYRNYFSEKAAERGWDYTELMYPSEMVFVAKKS